jgi:hypothetical protein
MSAQQNDNFDGAVANTLLPCDRFRLIEPLSRAFLVFVKRGLRVQIPPSAFREFVADADLGPNSDFRSHK